MQNATKEDYLKVIFKLSDGEDKAVATQDIAAKLGISSAAVTSMLKKLAKENLVSYKPYYGVRLLLEGRKVAVSTVRRHRVIEEFLVRFLHMGWDEVDVEAEVLEHCISEDIVQRMWKVLGEPQTDPHGSPIPDASGQFHIEESASVPLVQIDIAALCTVVRIRGASPEELRYLESIGLTIGSKCELIDRAPFKGPIMVKTKVKVSALDYSFCESIIVKRN